MTKNTDATIARAIALADDPDTALVPRAFAIELKRVVEFGRNAEVRAERANAEVRRAIADGQRAAIEADLLLRMIGEYVDAPTPVDTENKTERREG